MKRPFRHYQHRCCCRFPEEPAEIHSGVLGDLSHGFALRDSVKGDFGPWPFCALVTYNSLGEIQKSQPIWPPRNRPARHNADQAKRVHSLIHMQGYTPPHLSKCTQQGKFRGPPSLFFRNHRFFRRNSPPPPPPPFPPPPPPSPPPPLPLHPPIP